MKIGNMAGFGKVKIIAHRGMGPTSGLSGKGTATEDVPFGYWPENTLKAFTQGIKEGADGVEFDVYISKDGVPVIIHDNNLNLNVRGADRKGNNLGLVTEKTLEEIKQYDVGQGETIPTLQETVELFIKSNTERAEQSLPPLIMNVELKGVGTAEPSFSLISKYISDGLINKEYVVYCSLEHGELQRIRELDADAKLSPGIKTASLWGKDNILEPGFYIPMNIELPAKGIEYLEDLNNQLNVTAFDPVLFDIDAPLVDLASNLGVGIYASTSNFRDFSNKAFLQLLININRHVPVYFKTDEPGKIHDLLEKYEEFAELDLSSIIILEHEEVALLREEEIKRIPKVGQPESTLQLNDTKIETVADKFKSIAEKVILDLGKRLKLHITDTELPVNQNKELIKIIESFKNIEEYIPRTLALEQQVVKKIITALNEVSDHLVYGRALQSDLKLQLETLMPQLEEQEIKILNTQDKTDEVQSKIYSLKSDIEFFQKDALVSSIKLLNDIMSLPHNDSKIALAANIESLKNALHPDTYTHPSTDINDNTIAKFLDELSEDNGDFNIANLEFMKLINDELLIIFKGFQESDKQNETYWIRATEDVVQMNESLAKKIGEIRHDEL